MATAADRYLQSLVNADRSSLGLQPLSMDSAITQTAFNWSQRLDSDDSFFHDNPNTFAWDQYYNAGFQYPSGAYSYAVAENIEAGSGFFPNLSGTAQQQGYEDLFMQGYLNSPIHKGAIENPFFDRMGSYTDFGSWRDPGNGDSALNVTRFWGDSSDKKELTGTFFQDKDADGKYDIGEGLSGFKVQITDLSSHATPMQFITDEGGGFDVHNLTQGNYSFAITDPTGAQTRPQMFTVGDQNIDLSQMLRPEDFGTSTGGGGGPGHIAAATTEEDAKPKTHGFKMDTENKPPSITTFDKQAA